MGESIMFQQKDKLQLIPLKGFHFQDFSHYPRHPNTTSWGGVVFGPPKNHTYSNTEKTSGGMTGCPGVRNSCGMFFPQLPPSHDPLSSWPQLSLATCTKKINPKTFPSSVFVPKSKLAPPFPNEKKPWNKAVLFFFREWHSGGWAQPRLAPMLNHSQVAGEAGPQCPTSWWQRGGPGMAPKTRWNNSTGVNEP